MIIINFLAPLFIAWFAAHFTPIQSLIDKLFNYLPKSLKSYREYLSCFKCLSFWITLGMTFNPILAMAFSMGAYTYTRIMDNLKIYI